MLSPQGATRIGETQWQLEKRQHLKEELRKSLPLVDLQHGKNKPLNPAKLLRVANERAKAKAA